MDHYTATKNIADRLYSALDDADQLQRVVERLQQDPRASFANLVDADAAARAHLEKQADQSLRFIAVILAKSLEEAAPLLRKLDTGPTASLRTSVALTLAAQTATWLERDVSESSLTGTVKEIFDTLYLCFIALRDLDDKREDVLDALAKLAACAAEQILDPTKDCSAERMNYDAAVHAADVALNNLSNAC